MSRPHARTRAIARTRECERVIHGDDRAPCIVRDTGGQAGLITSTGVRVPNWQCVTYLLMASGRLYGLHALDLGD